MVSTTLPVISLAAAVGLLQMCPAPFITEAIWSGIAAGVVGGTLGAGATMCAKYCPSPKLRRHAASFNTLMARDYPPGVSQESIDQCTQQLNEQKDRGIQVFFTNVDDATVDIDHLPPACMNLVTVLSGNPAQAGGPVPIPMGSDKVQFRNLTPEDRQNLGHALGA
ncbi:hypothetical protein JDV02_007225 [Purpureocillium takamizusanense]|uniref:Uncharacterized protein n=1 Tax=Purpureocillium takamizusanense TaxID=2060973 RepID=A0A9Q8VC49_9HYPO|nr:uncharacterized protein JDV02_007225 [Purpureocillium takamizusanense]UNI21215.1 hypothetical protein JDV02_007225 [Purpureocillium takamizusanense]